MASHGAHDDEGEAQVASGVASPLTSTHQQAYRETSALQRDRAVRTRPPPRVMFTGVRFEDDAAPLSVESTGGATRFQRTNSTPRLRTNSDGINANNMEGNDSGSFPNVSLRRQGSGLVGGSSSNWSMRRQVSGLAGGSFTTPPANTPFQLLYQSFALPVSDERAIENAVRETLGKEPLGRGVSLLQRHVVAAPPVVVVADHVGENAGEYPHEGEEEEDNDDESAVLLNPGDELRTCENPHMHYVFRNLIRAPRGERPPPYTVKNPYSRSTLTVAVGPPAASASPAAASALAHAPAPAEEPLHSPFSPPNEEERSVRATGSSPLTNRRETAAFSREEAEDSSHCAANSGASSATVPHPTGTTSREPTAVNASDERSQGSTAISKGDADAAEAEEAVPAVETGTYLCTGAFHAEPITAAEIACEKMIVNAFNSLAKEKRRMELLEAFYVAHMQPYEQNASYTGDDWDDMTQVKVKKWFDIEFDARRGCFFLTIFKQRIRVFLFSFLFRAFCIFLFWVIMFCLLPKNWFYPGGLYFDTLSTIIFAGIAGTVVARVLDIPSIVGVIWAGLLWNNVPYTSRLTNGITLDMRQFLGMFGLSIGLIRAGLSLNVIRFKQKFKHYITFSLLPMAAEMVVHGVCCKYIYNYPNFRWAFAEGFLLSSIAPSVVVPVIIAFQRKGYGVRDGPSMMMLCSIAIDTASCVWGSEFLLALEFKKMSTALLIVLAPVQVIVGLVGGVILGVLVFVVTFYILFMEGERLPSVRTDRMLTLRHSVHVRYLSILFMVLVSFSAVAIGKRFSVLGGAAIGVVTIAGTFNYLCVRGGSADHLRVKADMAQTLTTVWDYIAMPCLFGLSGASVNVHELFARDFIGQAFGLVFIGIGTRCVFAMLSPIITRLGLSWQEIIFCGVGWIGKGSVQGSLGGLAQTYAEAELKAATTPEAIALAMERVAYGRKLKNTAILSVLVACPLCSIFLTRFTSRLLKPNT